MRQIWFAVTTIAALLLPALGLFAADDGFESIFDGKTLEGWDGNPDFWSVKDGCITGQTTKENPTKGNTFLIWRKGETADFELKLEYKIVGGNSGIQYRSFEVPNEKWVIGGYQGDFEAGDTYSGILYGERFRGILAQRGEKTVIGDDHKPKVVGKVGDTKEIQAKIKKEDWNEYHIIAKGFEFKHMINGVTTCEVTDEDTKDRRASGLLALQLHAGPPMTVQFRNIRLKQIKKDDKAAKIEKVLDQGTNVEFIQTPFKDVIRYLKDVHQISIEYEAKQLEKAGWSETTGITINSKAKLRDVLKLVLGERLKHEFTETGIRIVPVALANEGPGAQSAKKKVLFIAGKPSHGYGAHEHNAGCTLLAKHLKDAMPGYDTQVVLNGWPQDKSVFDGVDAIVMYCDGGGGHMVNPNLDQVDALAKKGVGIVCIHYAVEVPAKPSGEKFLDWIGGYFEMNWSVNPHWTAKFTKFPHHPIARGVKPFEINDEWYYHMRFRPEMKGVTPILTDMPPKETLNRGDGPHSGNPDVRKAVLERMEPQHVAWAAEREGGGRGFGFTGGHDHWNWGDPNFRKVMLNAIVWVAKGEVPQNGVEDKTVTLPELEANQDYPPPANFDREGIKKQKHIPDGDGKQAAARAQPAGPAAKPVFASKTVDPSTPNHSVEIDADITGAKQLYLVVSDAGDGFGCDWANWAEPRLVGASGEKKLTDLKWKSASAGFGNVNLNKNCGGNALSINGKSVEYGIGTHAVSVIAYDLPEGYTRFKARGGLDDGGTKQGCGSTVQFFVYTQQPAAQIASTNGPAGGNSATHEKENAVAGLEVAEGLEAALFSAEPEISNVTTIDIDHKGRIWVGEVKNYRKWNGSRPEGDRILVLEDTNGDGQSDKSTVFYQGRDIDSVHGICVLGNKVIVSALDKVQVLTDEDGDLKCDKKETLFSGIAGSQHDHGIHAFLFGPDGKLYFNFGNEGKQIKDKDGKPIVDLAGNEINNKRQPYQEGMVFRCNPDGSELETLGWNFRNNWEVTIDSFGSLWQSDNDDDGNKGVRINYVMEYGNYGYKDEMTGAGWQQKRENWENDIPSRHWHLNDPGVVPTLLLTGAGSPTGICVYEGRLLPKVFWDQMIHCDAGPNVCRAYPVKKDGAGYKAEMVNVLFGKKDNWFRPSDVCVAPDGSLFVGDWYDPGVGGHNQQEVDKGRIFRVAPPGTKYTVPKFDFSTVGGCIEALQNPCLSVRYLAYTGLQAKGQESATALEKLAKETDNPRIKARALWCAGKLPGNGQKTVMQLLNDQNPDLRIVGIRLARELKLGLPVLAGLANDKTPEVRRELAIACRHSKDSQIAANLWAELANQYDGKDRWYLEALGIAADKNWDACLDAWLSKASTSWNTPAGRDIIWRSRAKKTPELIGKILKDEKTAEEDQPRYYRALDFFSKAEKDAVLKSLLE